MDTKQTSTTLKLIMLPCLAHGHISPYLELAKKLSQRNFSIYFCSTPVNLTSIKAKLIKLDKDYSELIQLVELHLPSLPDLPPHYHTTNGLPPHLRGTLMKAIDMSMPNFSNILQTLKPNLIIYDTMYSWVPSLASTHNIPAVVFQIWGATMTSYFFHNQIHGYGGVKFPFPNIFLRKTDIERMLKAVGPHREELGSKISGFFEGIEGSCDILLLKSCREAEGKYLDYLSSLSKKKIVPVGFLVSDDSIVESKDKDIIIEWLNKKEEFSTVFVSFGSECYLSKEEMEEIALGLELSNMNFIWVIRFPVGEEMKVEEAMPKGFVERVKDRGLIVEGWAPQGQILKHQSTSGFFSHCGWGSVNETMSFGVPLIMMPMQSDQPIIARLAEELGVGLEILRDESGNIHRDEVAKVIKQVVTGESGEEIRKKVRELSNRIRDGEDEINGVVEELKKICSKHM